MALVVAVPVAHWAPALVVVDFVDHPSDVPDRGAGGSP